MVKAGKENVKVPDDLRRAWDEIRLCATLIRQGQARIVIATGKDGTRRRYTKVR